MGASLDRNRAEMLALLPRLRRFALALTGRATDADDLLQDTLERALRNFDQFTPGTRMDSWMFRIAQNLWIDNLRSRKARGQPVDIENAESVSVDGQRAAEARLMMSDTVRALAELPEEQRAVVALVLVDGLSYREAATVLQVPIGTVTSRLARGREALATQVLGHSTTAWEM
jgi:RNA polymerase sigma-70 factor, ECF subfamily